MDDELGLLRDYGNYIMAAILVGYGIIFSVYNSYYGPHDDEY